MDSVCGQEPFWNTSLTWTNNSWPQLTGCFLDSVVELVPCAWLLLTCPAYLYYLYMLPRNIQPPCWLFYSRMVTGAALWLVDVIAIFYFLGYTNLPIESISLGVWALTLMAYMFLVAMERSRDVVRSMVLLVFWLLAFVSSTILLYTRAMLQLETHERFTFTLMRCCLAWLLLVLACFSEYHGTKEKGHNPETSASPMAWLVYAWLEPLMRQGYRRPLQEDDVFELEPYNTTSQVVRRFLNVSHNESGQRGSPTGLKHRLNGTWNKKEETRHILASNCSINYTSETEDSPTDVQPNVASSGQRSFLMSLIQTFWWEAVYTQVGMLGFVAVNLVTPFILGWMIDYTKDLGEPSWHGYIYMLGLLVTKILYTAFNQSAQYLCNGLAVRVRSAAIGAIFRKTLNLSSESRKCSSFGEIVNLMSVDTNHLELFLNYAFWLWMGVMLLVFAVYFLYAVIGLSMLAGLGFISLMLVSSMLIAQRMRKYQDEMMKIKDRRINMTGEVLQGIKVIKLYGWEPLFIQKILNIRNDEIKVLFKHAVVDALDTFAYTASTFWITFFSFVAFVLLDSTHHLDAKTSFLVINYINLIRFAINSVPIAIRFSVKATTSIKRIDKFLQCEDLDPKNLKRNEHDDVAVRVQAASFSWDERGDLILHNINLEVMPGQVVAVVGPVGSGKSSLLSAVLGEMVNRGGRFNLNSTVAYVPQQAWIQNNSIRENILFGRDYDESFYKKVIEGCALNRDLEILPAGDSTEIGEKGINLSGGQKQRVSLARAVYSQADIYLFDDPLSAVDNHVGKHIFKHIMSKSGILKHKTRVLVTHGLQWLPSVDQIVVMQHGQVRESGTFQQLNARRGAFSDFMTQYLIENPPDGNATDDGSDLDIQQLDGHLHTVASEGDMSDDQNLSLTQQSGLSKSWDFNTLQWKGKKERLQFKSTLKTRSASKNSLDQPSQWDTNVNSSSSEERLDKSKLTTVEGNTGGKVNWTVYLELLKAYGFIYALVSMFFILGFHVSYNVSYLWLTTWNDDQELANFTLLPAGSGHRLEENIYFIKVYASLGLIQTLCCMTYAGLIQFRHVVTSRVIHEQLLNGIMRAPMSFFDTTPMGRILNRFSQDLDILDSEIFLELEVYLEHALYTLGILVIISYTFPVFVVVIIPVVIVFYFVQQFYIRTSCQLRRIASNNRSPVYAHFSETLSGVSVIRAHQHQARFITDSETKVDKFQKAVMASYAANNWIQTRLDIMTYVLVIAVSLFTAVYRGDVQPGLVGLSVTYVLMITKEMTFLMKMSSDLETNVVSLERLQEYSRVKSEAPWNIDEDPSSKLRSWPYDGQIAFSRFSTRYREGMDLVLKDVSFTINAGEKIGIVGRTGAGKSSMVLSLFRLIEAASGSIVIDGVDISKVGLHVLRRGLTILPQDPILFAGSLRMNLDPFHEKSDEELWECLEHAHLKPYVQSLPHGLDHSVGEGGENLSMGQRQLVCLARTLLRKTKILVLDEATAAVDVETDELIQKTIRTAFSDCTVLTIAHRINTVLDYDRILLLENGQVVEFNSPRVLLSDTTSAFYSVARKAGLVQ